ncbi:MAG: ATP-binding cassette domain-containing protein [Liquorilactobacillus ghanensis]|uniref:ABC transporter ATP-binding protein n=1 Tax=Liquorilactobacillus ghanensis TaxID=399370 RepID=UPI0039ECF932
MLNVDNIDIFIGHKKIVKKASFGAKSSEIIGLVGPNGAGKTTIMKTILGLTKFKGNIWIDKEKVTENNHHALSEVGALIEHPAIYPFLTGLQNLELYSHDQNDMNQIVSMLQMDAYIKNAAKGYSLGMKQKLGIAIALLNKPKLVILDEPMNGLDIEATIRVRKIIKRYAEQGTTFLISSHILSELQKVITKIVLVNNGEIIVNQGINEFNKINRKTYKLDTEDNSQSKQLFQENNISFSESEDCLLVKQADLIKIQDVLYKNQVYLSELSPIDANFEQLIVNILEKQRGQHNEK